MLVAPRIVNDVSYVTDIDHGNHFPWHLLLSVKTLYKNVQGSDIFSQSLKQLRHEPRMLL